jgi:Ser/Thr protein kinase RdoA (MazF antagonist)
MRPVFSDRMTAKDAAEAVEAAKVVLRRIGIPVAASAVLHISRHISVKLSPARIVARVVSAADVGAVEKLRTELEVARHLVRKSAPIVGPIADYSPGPYFHNDAALTLWQHLDHETVSDGDFMHVAMAASALRLVHEGLSDFDGQLPDFWDKPNQCRTLLENSSSLSALHPADREFLLATHSNLRMALDRLALDHVPIHGDAHLGNVFIVADGARWHDFEDVCRGPREWDLSGLVDADLAPFEPVNREVLSLLSYLRSLCVSVWCWDKFQLEGKREAAEYHLQYLKSAIAQSSI